MMQFKNDITNKGHAAAIKSSAKAIDRLFGAP